MENVSVTPAPVTLAERIGAIDALRGFAVLGILIMNIQSFSLVGAAYLNPTAYGDLSGANRWVWIISHIIADKKFMTIFSMLFGAGIVLMTDRIEARGSGARGIHYRRTMWLIVIGLLHAYLLWYGDILFTYGLCALLVYLFRRLSPGKLFAIGLVSFAIGSITFLFFGYSVPYWPQEAVRNTMGTWRPGLEVVTRELEAFRSGWLGQLKMRITQSLFLQTFYFLMQAGWRSGGLMLIGMAFYKWDILTGRRSKRFYAWLVAIGCAVGLPLVIIGVYRNFAAGWSLEYSMFLGSQFNYWGSVFVSSAFIGAMMLVSTYAMFRRLTGVLAAVGRMALTNYLMQTVICTTVFYGHGFGLFGRVERMWHPLIIVAVWIPQLVWSPLWLRHFRFGPAEWLWRTLTYRKSQPMYVIK
ncbi:MAG: DUF418 domain-containing protein [bacterium]|nr:MAG: DUF418 domain-containing protein [bacterium]